MRAPTHIMHFLQVHFLQVLQLCHVLVRALFQQTLHIHFLCPLLKAKETQMSQLLWSNASNNSRSFICHLVRADMAAEVLPKAEDTNLSITGQTQVTTAEILSAI